MDLGSSVNRATVAPDLKASYAIPPPFGVLFSERQLRNEITLRVLRASSLGRWRRTFARSAR